MYAEEIEDDGDGGFAAYLGAQDDEVERYNEPTHWYEDEDVVTHNLLIPMGKMIVNGRTSQHTRMSGPRNTT